MTDPVPSNSTPLSGNTPDPQKIPVTDNPDKVVRPINGETMIYHRKGPMQAIIKEIELVAPTPYTVLILRETGAGKENIAHDIHRISEENKQKKDSRHKVGPFIAIDCGAIAKDLIGSELFGHVKGSFTGAVAERKGKFDAAEGGTIFLDEIHNLPKDSQANLLRVLQDKSFYRVGGDTPINANVRVIVATNQLTRADKNGYKEDTLIPELYQRLREFEIHVPPLRDRLDDIPFLAEHFIKKEADRLGFHKSPTLTPESLEALKAYLWPGNIRELGNVIKGATLRAGDNGEITLKELRLSPGKSANADIISSHRIDTNTLPHNIDIALYPGAIPISSQDTDPILSYVETTLPHNAGNNMAIKSSTVLGEFTGEEKKRREASDTDIKKVRSIKKIRTDIFNRLKDHAPIRKVVENMQVPMNNFYHYLGPSASDVANIPHTFMVLLKDYIAREDLGELNPLLEELDEALLQKALEKRSAKGSKTKM